VAAKDETEEKNDVSQGEEREGDPEVEEEMVIERWAVGAGIGGEEPGGEQKRGGGTGRARDAGEKHVLRIARSIWRVFRALAGSKRILFGLLVEVDDGLNFYDAVVREQRGGSNGGPSRVGSLHEFVFHGAEGGELCRPVSFEVWALPDMERVEHDYVVEARAGRVQGRLEALKCATYLGLESSGIFSFALSPARDDS